MCQARDRRPQLSPFFALHCIIDFHLPVAREKSLLLCFSRGTPYGGIGSGFLAGSGQGKGTCFNDKCRPVVVPHVTHVPVVDSFIESVSVAVSSKALSRSTEAGGRRRQR